MDRPSLLRHDAVGMPAIRAGACTVGRIAGNTMRANARYLHTQPACQQKPQFMLRFYACARCGALLRVGGNCKRPPDVPAAVVLDAGPRGFGVAGATPSRQRWFIGTTGRCSGPV
jgi:hypothetical protein